MYTPQKLTAGQQEHVNKAKTAADTYRELKKETAEVSSELTAGLAEAEKMGITRYRLGQEVGMRTQSIDSRIDRASGKLK